MKKNLKKENRLAFLLLAKKEAQFKKLEKNLALWKKSEQRFPDQPKDENDPEKNIEYLQALKAYHKERNHRERILSQSCYKYYLSVKELNHFRKR